MVQQQTGIKPEAATKHDQPDQQGDQEPMHRMDYRGQPAWAVQHPDGSWHIDWDLRGASLYQLVLEGAKGEAPQLISQGPDLGALTVPSIAKAHRLRVIARMGNTDYAMSKVGTGNRDAKADIAEHLREWKSWKELASHDPDGTTLLHTTTDSFTFMGSGPWVRTVQRWQTTRTPQNLLTFHPDLGNLFPGAIVQSRNAIANGTLTTAQVEDAERAPVDLVISALNSGPGARVQPTLKETTNAIKAAVQGKKSIASDIRFSMAEAQTNEQTALSLNVSGKYGGFAASLDVASNREENQSSVVVFLQQHAFSASVQLLSPEDLFTDKFTEARLARLKTLGTMDRDNPPLIVSDVIYGRIIAIRIKSKASESDLAAAAKASYNGFGAEASAEVTAKHKKTLANSNIKVLAQGDDQKIIEATVDGTLVNYLSAEKNLDAFEPIGFVLKTLDDELATMSESYKYQTMTFA